MSKSKPKFPDVDVDIMFSAKVVADRRDCWPVDGTLFVFANTPRAIGRVCQAMDPNGPPVFAQVAGHAVFIYQSEGGSFWPEGGEDVPFLPATLAGIEAPLEAKPLIIHPRHGSRDPCDTCPQTTRMICKAYGGFMGLKTSLMGELPRVASECEIPALTVAHADVDDLDRVLASDMRWQHKESREKVLNIVNDHDLRRHATGVRLDKRRLEAAGFFVTSRLALVREDMGFKLKPHDDMVNRLFALSRIDAFNKESDPVKTKAMSDEHGVRFEFRDLDLKHPRHRDQNVEVGDLVFDSVHASAAIVAQRVARLDTAITKKTRDEYRKDHCTKCVYKKCRWPGMWRNPTETCVLTDDEVIAKYPNTDDARTWMASFAFSGKEIVKGKSRSLVWGPSTTKLGELPRWQTRRRSPPYSAAGVVVPTEVIGDDWQEQLAKVAHRISLSTVEEQARLFFALRQLWNFGHWYRDARFQKDQNGDIGRTSRNDVLYIKLVGDDIKIGSDTRASSSGGFMGYREGSIKADERPRFKTWYRHPYYESMKDWTGVPLGTKKSHIPIKIVD